VSTAGTTGVDEDEKERSNPAGPVASSRVRSAGLNWVSSLVLIATTVVTGLLVAPTVTRSLGPERVGAVRMLAEYAGYLTLLDLGVGMALGPLLARAVGRRGQGHDTIDGNQGPDLSSVMGAGVRAYLTLSLVSVAVGAVMALGLPVLVPVRPGLRGDVALGWAIILAGLLVLVVAPFRALLEAEQRGYLVNATLAVQAALSAVVLYVGARAGWGIAGQCLGMTLGLVPGALILAGIGLRRHPELVRGLARRPDAAAWVGLISLSAPSLLLSLAGRVSFMSDGLVAGMVLQPSAAAILFYTQRLVTIGQTQLQAVGNACWPGLMDLHHRGESERFRARLVELSSLVGVLSVATLVPIVAFNRSFFTLWGVAVPYGGDRVAILSAINAALMAQITLWCWCFVASGRVRTIMPAMVAGAALNLAASVAATWWTRDPVGPLIGTLISQTILALGVYPIALRRDFGIAEGRLLMAVARPLAWGLGFAAIVTGLTRNVGPSIPGGLIGLGAAMAATAMAFLALSFAVVLTPSERQVWLGRLTGLLPRRPS
jgi:O-antigen/teichoic acid export membrane protein